MKALSTWLFTIATWRKLTFSVILTLFIIFLLFPSLSTIYSSSDTPLQLLDANFKYTPEEAIQHIQSFTDAERAGYIKISLIADIIYPLIYTFTFSLLLSLLFESYRESTSILRYINLFPLLAMFFDLLENLSLILLTSSHPDYSFSIASFASIATSLKWGFLMAILLITAYRISYIRGQQRRISKNA